ncbi:hypothetical protein LCGC14_2091810 [marine sediment metagenome]|uniref:Uncharacterized protein n=1 Tax=marine sediment metagenome TaxID=412755 RepID=A0A0F9GQL0_9ZZZZ
MRFFEALRMAMLEGKKIRRRCWPHDQFIYYDLDCFVTPERNVRNDPVIFTGFTKDDFNSPFDKNNDMSWDLYVEEEKTKEVKITINNTEVPFILGSCSYTRTSRSPEDYMESLCFSIENTRKNKDIIDGFEFSSKHWKNSYRYFFRIVNEDGFSVNGYFESLVIKPRSDETIDYKFFNKENQT